MAEHMAGSFSPSLGLIAEAWGMPIDEVTTRTAQGVARSDRQIAAGPVPTGTVAATRTVVSCLHKGKPLMNFEAIWYVSDDVETSDGEEWEFRKSGWTVRVDGDTPLEVVISYPVSDADYPEFTPNLTAHRPVNAVPYVCAARPGFVTTVDLPQIIARFA
jgi:4-hydroxy-tetrahydrodipicolinate reductase